MAAEAATSAAAVVQAAAGVAEAAAVEGLAEAAAAASRRPVPIWTTKFRSDAARPGRPKGPRTSVRSPFHAGSAADNVLRDRNAIPYRKCVADLFAN